jgi:hypothetical protein
MAKRKKVFIVQELHWRYNDTYYQPAPAYDAPVKAFANRAKAEALRRDLEQKREIEASMMQGENKQFNRKERVHFYEIVETEVEA